MKYEFLEHTSEVKFRAYGKTIEEVFENAILAFAELIAKGNDISEKKEKSLKVKKKDNEGYFYDLLDEMIYLLDAENFIVSRGDVKVNEKGLEVIFYGDDSSKYEGLDHVKAVTYSEMYVCKKNKNWEAQVVLDV